MAFINSLMAAVAMAGHVVPLSATSELNLGVRRQGVGMSEVSKAPRPDQALAKVNGVEIKASEIEDLLWEARGAEILTEFIYYRVAKQEADRLKIIVTDSEVNEAVAKELKSLKANFPEGTSDEDALAQGGQSSGRLRLATRTNLLLTKIAFSDFDPKLYVRVSTIIVKPKSNSAADLSTAILACQSAYSRLQKGEKWETLVDELVEETQGRQARGYLGWRLISAFPEESQKEFLTIKDAGVTKPVQTSNGIQIFRIEGRGSSLKTGDLDQMKLELGEILRNNAVNKISKTLKVERLYPAPKKAGTP